MDGVTAPLNLDALQALCDAATPEPWEVSTILAGKREVGFQVEDARGCLLADVAWLEKHGFVNTPAEAKANAAFIAAARSALPALIQEVRRLQQPHAQLEHHILKMPLRSLGVFFDGTEYPVKP